MTFRDSSAIVPLVVREPASGRCSRWLRRDPALVVWSLTAVEVVSALARRRREGALSEERFAAARQRLSGLERAWAEVRALDVVRRRARRLLEAHALTAADALQLAAALVASEEDPPRLAFATLDRQLALAASREGFEAPA